MEEAEAQALRDGGDRRILQEGVGGAETGDVGGEESHISRGVCDGPGLQSPVVVGVPRAVLEGGDEGPTSGARGGE